MSNSLLNSEPNKRLKPKSVCGLMYFSTIMLHFVFQSKYTVFLWIFQKLRAQINFIVTRIVLQTNTISAPHLLNWSMAPNFHCDSRGFRPDIIGTTMVKIPPIADLSVNCIQFQRVFHVILWRMHYLLLSLFKI